MTYDLSFQATASTLDAAGIALSPSEAHGLLTGLVCAGNADDEAAFSALGDPGDFPELGHYVGALRTQLTQGLAGGELDFAPLLPGEDHSAPQQSRALTQWCSGFIAGYYFRGEDRRQGGSEAVGEALDDMAALADASGTVNEADLSELVEYLRVAVQLIYEETIDTA